MNSLLSSSTRYAAVRLPAMPVAIPGKSLLAVTYTLYAKLMS